MTRDFRVSFFFFFNDTATTEIYTLSLHDALPISVHLECCGSQVLRAGSSYAADLAIEVDLRVVKQLLGYGDRKSTRLNSSHSQISYAVFCLKKKNARTSRNHSDLDRSLAARRTIA